METSSNWSLKYAKFFKFNDETTQGGKPTQFSNDEDKAQNKNNDDFDAWEQLKLNTRMVKLDHAFQT